VFIVFPLFPVKLSPHLGDDNLRHMAVTAALNHTRLHAEDGAKAKTLSEWRTQN